MVLQPIVNINLTQNPSTEYEMCVIIRFENVNLVYL